MKNVKSIKLIAYVLIALGVVGIIYTIWDQNTSNPLVGYVDRDSTVVVTNDWKPYLSISDKSEDEIYEVIWDQKYGVTKKQYCVVVFRNESAKQYKLIAPWLDGAIIEYQNTNDIKFKKVRKNDVPGYDSQ